MKNMSTNREAEKGTACSTALRYVLVFLLVFCTIAVLFVGAVRAYSTATLRHPMRTVLGPLQSAILGELPTAEDVPNDTQEIVGIDGDRGLDAAAVVKQNLSLATRYTIRLRPAGGTDQFIAVTAPPGGLQFEVRDMTGDNVRNDLVLRPALVHWPLIVLLNDGHDHFTVAISATLPSSLDSGKRASGAQEVPETVALVYSASRASRLAGNGQSVPKLRQHFFSPLTQRLTNLTGYTSVSGRAPPSIVTRTQRI
jgi:hypothetical protein